MSTAAAVNTFQRSERLDFIRKVMNSLLASGSSYLYIFFLFNLLVEKKI